MIEYLEIRNYNREIVGRIQDVISIIWKTEYTGTGSFQIVVPFTEEYFSLLTPDNGYITRPDSRYSELGFIEKQEMTYTAGEGRTLTITGKFGLCLLERRIAFRKYGPYLLVTRTVGSSALIEESCTELIEEAFIRNDFTYHNISWVRIGPEGGYTETVGKSIDFTDTDLLTVIKKILSGAEFGHMFRFDRDDSLNLEYLVYKGEDTNLVFSQDYNNLLTFNFVHDYENYKSIALVTGDQKGANMICGFGGNWNSSLIAGPEVRQMVTQSSVTQTYNTPNGEASYTDQQYSDKMGEDWTNNHDKELDRQFIVSGTVDLSSYKLGVDYSLGDTVLIKDVETGLNKRCRIYALTEVQDEGVYFVEADFEGGND